MRKLTTRVSIKARRKRFPWLTTAILSSWLKLLIANLRVCLFRVGYYVFSDRRVLSVRRYLPATGNINDKSYKAFREYLPLFAILDRVAVTVHLNCSLKPRSSVLRPEKPLSNFDHLTSVHISCCSVFPVSNFDLRNVFSYLSRYQV